MRRLILAAALAVAPSIAHAQIGYLEGSIGIAMIPDVETEDYAVDTDVGFFEGRGELNYETEFSGGVEAGLTTGAFRFGAFWEMMSAQLDTGRIVGTLDGSPINLEGTDDEIADYLGLSFDENVHIFGVNGYYNFGPPAATVQPFVGVGIGGATFQDADTELAVNATLGARFALGERAYLGARYRFTWINGPEDDLGIAYKSIHVHTLSLILGFYFGGS